MLVLNCVKDQGCQSDKITLTKFIGFPPPSDKSCLQPDMIMKITWENYDENVPNVSKSEEEQRNIKNRLGKMKKQAQNGRTHRRRKGGFLFSDLHFLHVPDPLCPSF